MILLLLEFLKSQFAIRVPQVFTYFSTRMILASLTTLLITIIFGPFTIRKLTELKTGNTIRVGDCPPLAKIHAKKKHTPTMGGVLILGSMLISALLWMDLHSIYTLILILATIWFGLIGGFDDYLKQKHGNAKGLRGKKKLFFQLLFGAILGAYLVLPSLQSIVQIDNFFQAPSGKVYGSNGDQILLSKQLYTTYFLPFVKQPLFTIAGSACILGVLFSLFVITGSSNAVNLTDGLDGLAAGTTVQVCVVLAIFGFLSNHGEIAQYLNLYYIEGSGEIAIFLSAMFGACLGFLWYNGHPAEVFMGDTGSLSLGALLGISAILLRREFLLALIGGIFVVEALSVIIQVLSFRLRNKKRVFLCAPLHHHFEYMGMKETKVVLRFWIVGFILAIIGLASIKFQ